MTTFSVWNTAPLLDDCGATSTMDENNTCFDITENTRMASSTSSISDKENQEAPRIPTPRIPDESFFTLLRSAYFQAKEFSNDPHDETLFLDGSGGGPLVPMEIRFAPYGRGLFVTQDVTAGTAVIDTSQYGIFRTAEEWQGFLDALPRDWVKDVVQWSYVLEWNVDEDVAAIDLNMLSLSNHGPEPHHHVDDDESRQQGDVLLSQHGSNPLEMTAGTANIRLTEGGTTTQFATRDIANGEEILCDYSSFHHHNHKIEWYRNSWQTIVGVEQTSPE